MLYAKFSDGIWVGSEEVSQDLAFLKANDINAIIRFDVIVGEPVDIFNYVIPSEELLDMEIPAVIKRLDNICDIISALKSSNRNILIQCKDGKNKSLLVAGYFCKKRANVKSENILYKCKTIYFTDEQRGEEKLDEERVKKIQRGETVLDPSPEDLARIEERKKIRSLTNKSYCKIIKRQ